MTTPSFAMPTYDPTDFGNRPGDGPLFVGGQAPPQGSNALAITNPRDVPSTLSPLAEKQQHALTIVRDVWGGTQQMRSKTTAYLPRSPGEDSVNYNARLIRSVFFNVFRHTVIGLIGFVFRRDPDLGDDVPPQIANLAENIDNAGTHFDVFCRDVCTDAEIAGHAAILVDYPDTTKADIPRINGKPTREADLIFRPYWIPVQKENILSWRTEIINGRLILTQLVLKEPTYEPDGAFGQKEVIRYRVLYRLPLTAGGVEVGFRLLQIADNKAIVEVDRGVYANQVEIPIAEIPSSGRTALFESDPPLLDLAYLNIAHYQQYSDYAVSLHKTCVPILATIGLDQGEVAPTALVVGPNSVLNLPPAGDAKYVSHSGQALGNCKSALDDLIRDMAALGLAALASQKRAAETAASKQIDKDATDSALSVTARGLQDGIERALGFTARYMGLDSGGSVVINRDFEDMTMRPEMLVAYVTAVSKAGLPPRILLEAMQQGGLIGPDEDLDVIEAEMAANATAIADQAAQAKQDALAGVGVAPQDVGTDGQPLT